MTIETKYNIGEYVWAYLDEECIEGKIFHIRIYINKDDSVEGWYYIIFDDDDICLPASCLFPTKEELLKSL